MTHQQDLVAEALRRGATPGRGYAIGRIVSQVLHPVVLSLLSIFIVGFYGVADRAAGLGWAGLCALLQVVPPTIFFTIRLRQGAYSDEDVSDRHQRNELYLVGMLNLVVGTLLVALFGAPLPLIAMLASAALINALCWLINRFWKISIHSASIGSAATLAAIYSQPLGLFLWACAATLGWARVRTRNHTPMQVVAGASLAGVCVLGSYMAFGLL